PPASPPARTTRRSRSSPFPDTPVPCRAMSVEALTVSDVLRKVRNAAAREFRGPVWVAGEIRKLDDRSGTLYLDLVEHGAGRFEGGDVSLTAVCFKTKWRRLQAELADAGAALAPGREVRLNGTVTVWDNGRVSLEVTAVDVAAL